MQQDSCEQVDGHPLTRHYPLSHTGRNGFNYVRYGIVHVWWPLFLDALGDLLSAPVLPYILEPPSANSCPVEAELGVKALQSFHLKVIFRLCRDSKRR